MSGKRNTSFNTMVKKFMRDHNIPSKKDVQKLMARLERMEKTIERLADEKAKKKPADSRSRVAADKVTEVIREYEDGVGFREIQQRTGFEEKKLRNLIFRLKKEGRIVTLSRGIYYVP